MENTDKKVSMRVLLASLIGSSIEWFDYFLYGAVTALVLNKQYFPTSDPVVGVMLAYLTFALSFYIRPFGGRKLLYLWEAIERDMGEFSGHCAAAIPMANGGAAHG